MSICTPACWCLSIHTCTYWVLQQEILWAEFNRAETILSENNRPLRTSPSKLLNPWTLLTGLPLLHTGAPSWMWAIPRFFRYTTQFGVTEAAEGDCLTQWCSQLWVKVLGGAPCGAAPPRWERQRRQPAAVSIHLAALSLLSQTVYITLFNPLLNRL